MPLFLDKVLAQLAYPLGLSLGMLVLGLALLAMNRRRLAAGLMVVAVFWVGLWSIPAVSDALRLSLERQFVNSPVAELPVVDAVVVLGGGMSGASSARPYPDLGAAADRVWHGARIFHAGRAPVVVVSGGRLPWLGADGAEAEAMRVFLHDLGVPTAAIRLEDRSRNTRENALFTAELLRAEGVDRVLLVTSALHMPRALGTFQAVGIDAIPAPTDFEIIPRPRNILDWFPDAEALAASTRALKEYLGLQVYRWRRWIAAPRSR